MNKIILDLCGGSGAWSKPYLDAGYEVYNLTLPLWDIRLMKAYSFTGNTEKKVYGILAAPPCTYFASSGARWKRTKEQMLDALSIVDACLRAVIIYKPKFWALENPIGKLTSYLGKPEMYFNPCDYGDPYTKRTALWGNFNIPIKQYVEPTEGSKLHRLPPSIKRAELRSITPSGFAKAFFESNQ